MNPAAWFIHTITVASPNGVGNAGDLTYGTQGTVPGRVVSDSSLVMDAFGVERQVSFKVASGSAIALDARVWLPGDDTSSTAAARRPIRAVSAPTKDGSYTLYETYF